MSDTVQYAKYLLAVPEVPLPIAAFDAAWYPSGPEGRALLVGGGYAVETAIGTELEPATGIELTVEGAVLAASPLGERAEVPVS
jgi:hypothetical protein